MESFEFEVDCKIEGMRQFMLDQMKEFRERLQTLEGLGAELGESFAGLKRDLEAADESTKRLRTEFESSKSAMLRVPSPIASSSPFDQDGQTPFVPLPRPGLPPFDLGERSREPVFSPPQELDEVQDDDLRAKLEVVLERSPAKPKLISQIQHGFIVNFIDESEDKSSNLYSNASIKQLIEEGVRHKMWTPKYVVPGSKHDFCTFLKDKVKSMLTRRKAAEEKERLKAELNKM